MWQTGRVGFLCVTNGLYFWTAHLRLSGGLAQIWNIPAPVYCSGRRNLASKQLAQTPCTDNTFWRRGVRVEPTLHCSFCKNRCSLPTLDDIYKYGPKDNMNSEASVTSLLCLEDVRNTSKEQHSALGEHDCRNPYYFQYRSLYGYYQEVSSHDVYPSAAVAVAELLKASSVPAVIGGGG